MLRAQTMIFEVGSKNMKRKMSPWILIALGTGVVVFSKWIVFPGLEVLVGIETIVGADNVVRLKDGGYVFTNPDAMLLWTASVAFIGVLMIAGGILLLIKNRKIAKRQQDSKLDNLTGAC